MSNEKNLTSDLLGKKITFSKQMIRTSAVFNRHPRKPISGRKWIEMAFKEQTGFIVGRRVLQEGYSEWYGEEHGNVWQRKGSVSVYLVATSMNKKPIYIPIQEVIL